MAARQLMPMKTHPFPFPLSPFYLLHYCPFTTFTSFRPVGAGSLHAVWGTANSVLSFLLHLRYIGLDARIAAVYSFTI
jgi:hypothetical protein